MVDRDRPGEPATFLFSPVIWGYHPTAAAPALLLVLARSAATPGSFGRSTWAGSPPSACWVVSWREFGEMYWAVLLLGGLLLWTQRYQSSTP